MNGGAVLEMGLMYFSTQFGAIWSFKIIFYITFIAGKGGMPRNFKTTKSIGLEHDALTTHFPGCWKLILVVYLILVHFFHVPQKNHQSKKSLIPSKVTVAEILELWVSRFSLGSRDSHHFAVQFRRYQPWLSCGLSLAQQLEPPGDFEENNGETFATGPGGRCRGGNFGLEKNAGGFLLVGKLVGGFKYDFYFYPIWRRFPIWLILFNWVKTTN